MKLCRPQTPKNRLAYSNLDILTNLQLHEFFEESLLQSLAGRKPTPPTLRSQALWSKVDK